MTHEEILLKTETLYDSDAEDWIPDFENEDLFGKNERVTEREEENNDDAQGPPAEYKVFNREERLDIIKELQVKPCSVLLKRDLKLSEFACWRANAEQEMIGELKKVDKEQKKIKKLQKSIRTRKKTLKKIKKQIGVKKISWKSDETRISYANRT